MEKIITFLEEINRISDSISTSEPDESVIAKLMVIDSICELCAEEVNSIQSKYYKARKEIEKKENNGCVVAE